MMYFAVSCETFFMRIPSRACEKGPCPISCRRIAIIAKAKERFESIEKTPLVQNALVQAPIAWLTRGKNLVTILVIPSQKEIQP